MRKHKLTWAIAVIMLVLLMGLPSVYAGDEARTGTASGEQLLVPVGARDLALGGSNVAFSSGLDAIYWNPAGFSSMSSRAAGTFSTMTIFNDIKVNYLAIGVKAGKFGSVGFSLKAFDFGNIPYTTVEDMDGASGRTFSPTFLTGAVTYSRKLTDAIQVGISGKFITEQVPRASGSAVAFDIGIQYHELGGISGLSMGLVVKNIGTDMQYSGSAFLLKDAQGNFSEIPTASFQLPATVELGVGYKRNINEENSLILNGNFVNNNFGNDNFKFGAEYNYNDLIALRGGYLFAQDVEAEAQLYTFTLGVGLHYKFGNTDLSLDYAFRDSQYFDGNNLFQLTIGF